MQIFIGNPVTGSEAIVLRKLHDCLKARSGLLLVNFYVGSRQFDYVVVLQNYTASVELKSVRGTIFGDQNGDWSIEDLTGTKHVYAGFNPWRQAHEQALALSDEMKRYQHKTPQVPAALGAAFYREFDAIACIYPRIETGSQFNVTAFKARVLGLEDVLSAIQTGAKSRSWKIEDWQQFAINSLKLRPASLGEAIDQRVYEARRTIDDFQHRVSIFYRTSLPALLEPSPGQLLRGEKLIEILSEPVHHALIGPSGSTKSFHLRHLIAALSEGVSEAPIPLGVRTYDGSDLSSHLQKAISPFTQRSIKPLLDDLAAASVTPVLVVDGLNECPEAHRPTLIEKLQAFALQFDARIVLSDQASVNLPPDICCRETQIGLPEQQEKVQIFAYYAGEPPTDALAYKSQSFTNAFDLRLAGLCYSRGASPQSRWDLYSRYIRDTLEDLEVVGAAFLRSIAAEMREELVFAIRRDRFESLAERFFQREATPLASLQKLLRSRLLVTGDDYVSFEHELLFDYFRAGEIIRNALSTEVLASEFDRPRNKQLLEFVLGYSQNSDEIVRLLNDADDVTTLGLALRGNCGPVAENVIRKQCSTLLESGLRELSEITVQCQTSVDEEGRKRLNWLDVDGSDRRSKREVLLCAVIVENLDDNEIRDGVLRLIHAMDTTFLDTVCSAADAAGIRTRRAIDEAIWRFGGLSQYTGDNLVGSGILSSIRYSRMMSNRMSTLPILPLLVEAAYSTERNHFSMFTALIELQHGGHDIEVGKLRRFAERGWKTSLSWIRTESVRLLSSLRHQAHSTAGEEVAEIRTLLQSFETNNILVNTEILEALAAYDGYDRPVSTESAFQEMIELIEASDEPTVDQKETADAFTTTWAQYRRDAADSCLGKIFEGVFQNAYYEAFEMLTGAQKKSILELAAMAQRYGFNAGWILGQLLPLSDTSTTPVFLRYITEMDAKTSVPQETVGAFLLAVRGFARFHENPPAIPEAATGDKRAWGVVASILFWWLQGDEAHDEIRAGWETINSEFMLCIPDILYRIGESQWHQHEEPIRLEKIFPDFLRPILESCLQRPAEFTSLFNYGGSRDNSVVKKVIHTLEEIGDRESIPVLDTLAEHAVYGRDVIRAIQAIRRRIY